MSNLPSYYLPVLVSTCVEVLWKSLEHGLQLLSSKNFQKVFGDGRAKAKSIYPWALKMWHRRLRLLRA